VILKKHTLTFLTVAGFPGANKTLQRPANIIRVPTRIFIMQILDDRCWLDLRTGLKQEKDIAQPDIIKRVLADLPVSSTRLLPLSFFNAPSGAD